MYTRKTGFAIAMVVSLCLILLGFLKGQPAGVYAKAIRICLECVGIG